MGDWQLPDRVQATSAQLQQQSRLFCYAVESRQVDEVAALVFNSWNFADITIQGLNVLMYVALQDLLDIMQVHFKHGADVNRQDANCGILLHCAAKGVSSELVRLLVRKGLDIEAVNDPGETPLMMSAR
jgi:ankyrin repeat protein